MDLQTDCQFWASHILNELFISDSFPVADWGWNNLESPWTKVLLKPNTSSGYFLWRCSSKRGSQVGFQLELPSHNDRQSFLCAAADSNAISLCAILVRTLTLTCYLKKFTPSFSQISMILKTLLIFLISTLVGWYSEFGCLWEHFLSIEVLILPQMEFKVEEVTFYFE